MIVPPALQVGCWPVLTRILGRKVRDTAETGFLFSRVRDLFLH